MTLTLILALTTAMMIAAARILRADPPAKAGAETVALIDKALADAKPQAADDRLTTLQGAPKAVMEPRPHNLLISTKLQTVLDQPKTSVNKQVKSLQIALSESAAILNFGIKKEADLPKGFECSPVHDRPELRANAARFIV